MQIRHPPHPGEHRWEWGEGGRPALLPDHPGQGGRACAHSLRQVGVGVGVGEDTSTGPWWCVIWAFRIVVLGDRGVGKTSIVQVKGLQMFWIDEEPLNFLLKFVNSPHPREERPTIQFRGLWIIHTVENTPQQWWRRNTTQGTFSSHDFFAPYFVFFLSFCSPPISFSADSKYIKQCLINILKICLS